MDVDVLFFVYNAHTVHVHCALLYINFVYCISCLVDTAFMFIIGGLLIVKMLQARHPDIQANAFVAFFCFAIVIFLTFVGIVSIPDYTS